MKKFCRLMLLGLAIICPGMAGEKFQPEFYAFYNGMPAGTHEETAAFLKETGFTGVSQIYGRDGGDKLTERVSVYEKVEVKVLSIYVPATKEPIQEEMVKGLADRGGMIELTVKEVNEEVVESIRQTASMAEKLKIKVVLYPHAALAVETMPQAMDLIAKVDHPNLGVMFNLCHFLKSEKAGDLEKVLDAAGDRLFAVSTCGADTDGKGWEQLIQTLDKGSFPQRRLFDKLKAMGFAGPVGLQCYAIKGDKKANLKASMAAWKELMGGL